MQSKNINCFQRWSSWRKEEETTVKIEKLTKEFGEVLQCLCKHFWAVLQRVKQWYGTTRAVFLSDIDRRCPIQPWLRNMKIYLGNYTLSLVVGFKGGIVEICLTDKTVSLSWPAPSSAAPPSSTSSASTSSIFFPVLAHVRWLIYSVHTDRRQDTSKQKRDSAEQWYLGSAGKGLSSKNVRLDQGFRIVSQFSLHPETLERDVLVQMSFPIVVKKGWLLKQGGWIKSWKRRMFALDITGNTSTRLLMKCSHLRSTQLLRLPRRVPCSSASRLHRRQFCHLGEETL